ncbi:scavenger receptor class F member 1-like, partial [Thamnophis elegans]|uniref:scavenger receptor class F member 1-like n=1 Tax=Thamnophis elegans TaxID=35005 RepID=UPI001378ECA7
SALPEGSLLPRTAALYPSPFAIPRTSSIAKGKRPSVSFAEGTHFGPQSPRAPPEALNPTRKPTASDSSAQGAAPLEADHPTGASCHAPGRSCDEEVAPAPWEDNGRPPGGHPSSSHRSWAGAEAPGAAAAEAGGHEPSITTIYVTVGQARSGSEDPPPAAQRPQGSGQEEAAWPRSLQRDAGKGTSRKLVPEKEPSMAEGEGLLAPDQQGEEGGGSSGSLEP